MKTPEIETVLREWMSGVLEAGMKNKSGRSRALRQVEKELYNRIVIKNEDDRPQRVQEMRFKAMRNFLHSAVKALSKGHVSEAAWQFLMHTFARKFVMAGTITTEGFRLWHG